jgi:CRP/FNR family transcriptional regulator, cyclic AMP receptor protein
MRDMLAAREIVQRQGWLSQTPTAFQCDVLDRCILQDIESGARLFADGVPTNDMYGLVAGQIGVWIAHGRRNPRLVHFLRPGGWFESLPAFAGQGLRVSLSASRGVEVLRLPQQAMREIVALHPEAWRLFALVSAGYVRVATLAADDLLIRDHIKRCIAVLLRLGGCRVVTPPSSMPIDVDLNQQGLATLSNLARTTAGQILRTLEDSGQLEVSYRHIRILAPDALRAMLVE